MNRKIDRLLPVFIILAITMLVGCDDILEQDISEEEVNVLSPAENLVSNSSNITFWWDFLDGANEYELQVVSPSFENVQEILLDTIITTNKLIKSFELGDYQWSLRAINNGYSTSYFSQSFKIDDQIPPEKPRLVSPSFGALITTFPTTFEWERASEDAVSDIIFIYEVVSEDTSLVQGFPNTVDLPAFEIASLDSGTYFWGVKSVDGAGNESELAESDRWKFTVDD